MMPSIEKVYGETDQQPDKQTQPVVDRQGKHQQEAEGDTKKRHKGHERAAEWAGHRGIDPAHDEDCGAYDYKG